MTDAADLAKAMPDIARKFWGEPNARHSTKHQLRWGSNGARAVDISKGTWFDHEAKQGGGVLDLLKREHVAEPWEWLRQQGYANGDGGDNKQHKIAATHDYVDETGALLFQVVRYDHPKAFKQRRPDGRGGWVWSVKGVRQVPYRLPELIEAIALEQRVFIVEGEKDVETLARHGITATTNAMGAGKWNTNLVEHFSGADVIVIPDNDDAGRKHANDVARSLAGSAARIRRLDLPGLPDKGDVSDWFGSGTVEAFNALTDQAPDWTEGDTDELDLPMIDVSAWDGAPVPPRDWAVRDRIARRNVTLLSGEGGVGKSILIMQLAAAHVLARDWFGALPEPGAVIYINAEDDERELHFRLDAIRAHLGTTFAALKDLHLVPLAGEDALLGTPNKTGIIKPTPLFEQLKQAATSIKPVLIALDTAADMFGGNENDRAQVRQFIGLLRGLAIAANAGVLLASHPSLTGVNTDSGLSGSTGWHNSVRSRLYFKPADADGDKPNTDLRELTVRKNNYGPSGEVIRMVWQRGVFVPVSAPSSIERAAAERAAEHTFLDLLDKFTRQGQTLSPHSSSSGNYAPAMFAKHRDANGTGKAAFVDAMQRLLDAGTIHVEPYGRPSRPAFKLART